MGSNAVINKPLAAMGLTASHQFLTDGEAKNNQGNIASLAGKIGVPKEVVSDLLTRDVGSLAKRGNVTLKRLENYLQQALDKPGTAMKGNHHLVQTYLALVQNARQVGSPNKPAAARDVHQVLSDAYTSIAVDHGNHAATSMANSRLSHLSNDGRGAQTHQQRAEHHKQQAKLHLAQAHALAPTERGKDAVRLMGVQVRQAQGRFDKK